MHKKTVYTKHSRRFSTLAGPLQRIKKNERYTVNFNKIVAYESTFYRIWIQLLAYGALATTVGFGIVLFQPEHWLVTIQPDSPTYIYNLVMLLCLSLLQIALFIGTYSATRATLKSRDPIPVASPKGLKVAFVTTRAPGEPLEMVQNTLKAIKNVRYPQGTVDTWLLDETNDPELITFCKKNGIRHFSRKGITKWNTQKYSKRILARFASWYLRALTLGRIGNIKVEVSGDPYYAAKSKHGNFNSWRKFLKNTRTEYDILAGVDTDHVPQPNYLQRILGYFRDEDVAYVVGPQVYGNYAPGAEGLVARWAESQASFFQSTIQRAANASNSPMFVGTNYAIRFKVLDQIGGFQPCITEDMATGLAIHTKQNPDTGRKWKSIYTPDVLAIGEGPEFWGPYFTQQWRWAAGTFDTWRRVVWRCIFKLSPKALLHYFLILTFYPITSIVWLLSMVSSLLYLSTGSTAVLAPWNQFVSLYLMMIVTQLSLYFWNRRYNVSPHEPAGSLGVTGMLISTLTAPIYFSALIGILFGKKPHFVVTKKGDSSNPDWLPTFRTHLQWAAIIVAGLIFGAVQGHTHPAMLLWTLTQLLICIVPFVLGMRLAIPERRRIKRENIRNEVSRQELQSA